LRAIDPAELAIAPQLPGPARRWCRSGRIATAASCFTNRRRDRQQLSGTIRLLSGTIRLPAGSAAAPLRVPSVVPELRQLLYRQRNSQLRGAYPRTLVIAVLTFLPIRTALIKASIYSTEAVSCHASSRNTTSTSGRQTDPRKPVGTVAMALQRRSTSAHRVAAPAAEAAVNATCEHAAVTGLDVVKARNSLHMSHVFRPAFTTSRPAGGGARPALWLARRSRTLHARRSEAEPR
jgi:autotransporter translocation and assembly factor TamB